MIGWLVFASVLFGPPLLGFAFAPRSFRRFCLVICVPWLSYVMLVPNRGADNPLIFLDAIPLAVVAGAIAVEVAMVARYLLAGRAAHD